MIDLYTGFHFPGELRMLNRICDGITDGVIVSLGSYRGQMDCALALHAHVPVYAIDHRQGSSGDPFTFTDDDRVHWMQNVLALGLSAKIRPVNLPSLAVAYVFAEPVALLWIDADHSYEGVSGDLRGWLPHVVDGGLVVCHDVNLEGVARALAEHPELELIEECDLTKVFRLHHRAEKPKPDAAAKQPNKIVDIPALIDDAPIEFGIAAEVKSNRPKAPAGRRKK